MEKVVDQQPIHGIDLLIAGVVGAIGGGIGGGLGPPIVGATGGGTATITTGIGFTVMPGGALAVSASTVTVSTKEAILATTQVTAMAGAAGLANRVHMTAAGGPDPAREMAEKEAANARNEQLEQHHSDPKFMGGDPKQPSTPMPRAPHRGAGDSLHNDLNDFLRGKTDAAGNHMRPQPGNSGARIRDNFTRQELLNALADFYKKYCDKYPDAARDFFHQHPGLK